MADQRETRGGPLGQRLVTGAAGNVGRGPVPSTRAMSEQRRRGCSQKRNTWAKPAPSVAPSRLTISRSPRRRAPCSAVRSAMPPRLSEGRGVALDRVASLAARIKRLLSVYPAGMQANRSQKRWHIERHLLWRVSAWSAREWDWRCAQTGSAGIVGRFSLSRNSSTRPLLKRRWRLPSGASISSRSRSPKTSGWRSRRAALDPFRSHQAGGELRSPEGSQAG